MKRRLARQWSFLIACVVIVLVFAWLKSLPPPSRSAKTPVSGPAGEFLARKERWGAKTGYEAPDIDIAHPMTTTVRDLIVLPRPAELPSRGGPGSERYGATENTCYTIDAKLVRYKAEDDDEDYHIVITDYDNPGKTMIVEIPEPGDVDSSSPWRESIVSARDAFDAAFHPTKRFTRRSAHIRVTGIGFFDFLHGQSGVAPNGIELHPVLRIEVLD